LQLSWVPVLVKGLYQTEWNAVSTHISHRRIYLFSTRCSVGSCGVLCMRNINCKPHWLVICYLSRIFLIVNVMYNFERMSRYILYEVEANHHLISIRLYFILTILITEDGSRSTSLIPSHFIEVPELSQEGSYICVLGISNLHISTIFLLNAGTFPTVWYIFFDHFIIGNKKKPAELQLYRQV
jgi:hypothetical protein